MLARLSIALCTKKHGIRYNVGMSYYDPCCCFSCGTLLKDEYDRRGRGCIYCMTVCPNCSRDVTKKEIKQDGDETYCIFCENDYLKRKRQQELIEQSFGELENTDNLSIEELEQRLQGVDMEEMTSNLRKMRIDTLKNMAKINGGRMPGGLEKMSDVELDKIIKSQFEKRMRNS